MTVAGTNISRRAACSAGTHNGTYVNGKRITRKMLTEQDIISIGGAP
jgi:pSer/pThr/pTyr-binding forkhead associated (FHA) protein